MHQLHALERLVSPHSITRVRRYRQHVPHPSFRMRQHKFKVDICMIGYFSLYS